MTMYEVIKVIIQTNINDDISKVLANSEQSNLVICSHLSSYIDYDGSIYLVTEYKITTRSRIFIEKLIREKHGVLL